MCVIKGCMVHRCTTPSGVTVAFVSNIDGAPRSTGGTMGWGGALFAGDVASASWFALGDLLCFRLCIPNILGEDKAEAGGEIS